MLFCISVKAEVVEPGCRLPQNFSGDWINTANLDADVFINETHIIETWYPDEGRYRRTIYVCRETRDSRYMMARLTVDGCQKDYICFDFVPRHHNVIRYRKGIAVIKDNFHTVCSWVQFPNKRSWKYDLFLCKFWHMFSYLLLSVETNLNLLQVRKLYYLKKYYRKIMIKFSYV